jgi:hypothetical protein
MMALNTRFEFISHAPNHAVTPHFAVYRDTYSAYNTSNGVNAAAVTDEALVHPHHTLRFSHQGQYLGEAALLLRGRIAGANEQCIHDAQEVTRHGLRWPLATAKADAAAWAKLEESNTSVISVLAKAGEALSGFASVHAADAELEAGSGITIALPLVAADDSLSHRAICVRVFRSSKAALKVDSVLLSATLHNADNFLNVDRISIDRPLLEALLPAIDVANHPERAISGLLGATLPSDMPRSRSAAQRVQGRTEPTENSESFDQITGTAFPFNFFH